MSQPRFVMFVRYKWLEDVCRIFTNKRIKFIEKRYQLCYNKLRKDNTGDYDEKKIYTVCCDYGDTALFFKLRHKIYI